MTTEVDEFLEHFGVRGMHWGSRKASASSSSSKSLKPKEVKKGMEGLKPNFAGSVKALHESHKGTRTLTKRQKVGASMVVAGTAVQAGTVALGTAWLAHRAYGSIKVGRIKKAQDEALMNSAKLFLNRRAPRLNTLSVYALRPNGGGGWS